MIVAAFIQWLKDVRDFIDPPPERTRDPDELAMERQHEREKEPRGFEIILPGDNPKK